MGNEEDGNQPPIGSSLIIKVSYSRIQSHWALALPKAVRQVVVRRIVG